MDVWEWHEDESHGDYHGGEGGRDNEFPFFEIEYNGVHDIDYTGCGNHCLLTLPEMSVKL